MEQASCFRDHALTSTQLETFLKARALVHRQAQPRGDNQSAVETPPVRLKHFAERAVVGQRTVTVGIATAQSSLSKESDSDDEEDGEEGLGRIFEGDSMNSSTGRGRVPIHWLCMGEDCSHNVSRTCGNLDENDYDADDAEVEQANPIQFIGMNHVHVSRFCWPLFECIAFWREFSRLFPSFQKESFVNR